MKTSTKFSLLIFAPVLIAFLLPALFFLPASVLFTLTAMIDPKVPLVNAVFYDMWIIGPILAALGLVYIGGRIHSHHQRGLSPRAVWSATWAVFTIALFFANWVWVTEITSIGASETPEHKFLSLTALSAAGLSLLAQALVIPWLIVVSRMCSWAGTVEATPSNNPMV